MRIRRFCLVRSAVWVLSASFVLLLGGCGDDTPAPGPEVARPVKILTIGGGGGRATLEYPGQVSAAQHAEMAFEVAGKIAELPVTEGERVEQGAMLAALDARDYQAARDAAAAERRRAQADHGRAKQLFEADALSKRDLEMAQQRYEVTAASERTAAKAVEDATLRAPFGGVVAKLLAEKFENVQAKQVVLVVQDTSSFEMKIALPEADLAYGETNARPEDRGSRIRAQVSVSAFPGRLFSAKLTEISTTADPVTRTFEATLAFAQPDDALVLPGMTGKAIIQMPERSADAGASLIPSAAVVADESGQGFVWRVDPGSMVVSHAPVELGALSGDRIAVTGGLSSGDLIAISGVHHLRDGMVVRRLEK